MYTTLQLIDFATLSRLRERGKWQPNQPITLSLALPQVGEGTCVHRLALKGEELDFGE